VNLPWLILAFSYHNPVTLSDVTSEAGDWRECGLNVEVLVVERYVLKRSD
jgi:hypothetical protein